MPTSEKGAEWGSCHCLALVASAPCQGQSCCGGRGGGCPRAHLGHGVCGKRSRACSSRPSCHPLPVLSRWTSASLAARAAGKHSASRRSRSFRTVPATSVPSVSPFPESPVRANRRHRTWASSLRNRHPLSRAPFHSLCGTGPPLLPRGVSSVQCACLPGKPDPVPVPVPVPAPLSARGRRWWDCHCSHSFPGSWAATPGGKRPQEESGKASPGRLVLVPFVSFPLP